MIEKERGDVCDRSNKTTIEYAKVCSKVGVPNSWNRVEIFQV